ncbi:MAG: CopD family protein [Hydrogenophaga sp.]|uniref:CopD family protein n=1 Tax=Hydrogenophaga sp. TaxID=1904254 RepID=UPI0025BF63B1|nr:CopD family protein [Hydrogenophaga sp.]MBU7575346.1 CopD family protein [Hydrogenophaga sp.]
MIFSALKLVHVLAVILWVGGMAFAHFFLRPSVQALEPPVRLRLLQTVMQRFFSVVLWASLVVLVTGLWMIGRVAKETVQAGLAFNMPLDWTIMATLGIVMIAIFGHIRFALFKRLTRTVAASDWPAAGAAMASIRSWVFVNLCIGIVIVCVTLLMG